MGDNLQRQINHQGSFQEEHAKIQQQIKEGKRTTDWYVPTGVPLLNFGLSRGT